MLSFILFSPHFQQEFDLLHPSVIHTDSAEPQNVTLSQEIIPGFHFHFHFFTAVSSPLFCRRYWGQVNTRLLFLSIGDFFRVFFLENAQTEVWCREPRWSTESAKCGQHAVMSVLILMIWEE